MERIEDTVLKAPDSIVFGDINVPVYYDANLDTPVFKLKDLGYSVKMLEQIEEDEYFTHAGEIFVTELGLYNLLSQDSGKNARLWRRVVHEQLIKLRKENGLNIWDQFDDWNEAASEYYFDEETGRMMKSVTVEGGDVVQIPA